MGMEINMKDAKWYLPGIGKYYKIDMDEMDLDTLEAEDVNKLWGMNIEEIIKPVNPPSTPVEPSEPEEEEIPKVEPEIPETDDNEPTTPIPEPSVPEPEEPEVVEPELEELIIYDGTYLLAPRTYLTVVVGTWEIIIREKGIKTVSGKYATQGILLRRYPNETVEVVNIVDGEILFSTVEEDVEEDENVV